MMVKIELLKEFNEPILPIIRLTKSRSKKTGTATFIFIQPLLFTYFKNNSILPFYLKKVSLIWGEKKIISKDIKVFFSQGKPFLLKVIFIFKNSQEWFNFLNFMRSYSKETGLTFISLK